MSTDGAQMTFQLVQIDDSACIKRYTDVVSYSCLILSKILGLLAVFSWDPREFFLLPMLDI